VARFKLRASQALNKMRDLSYGPEEVLKGKSARAFVQTVFRYSQAVTVQLIDPGVDEATS